MVSRREFLKLGMLALASQALGGEARSSFPLPQDEYDYPSATVGRITRYPSESVYREPVDDPRLIVRQVFFDEIVNLYYEVTPPTGPAWNPRWYRVWDGYIHSARVQLVKFRFNPVLSRIGEAGQLCEVTVPFTQTYIYRFRSGWQPYYRLYYQSTHWAIAIDEGPNGEAWYRLQDELTNEEYFAPAHHLYPFPDDELSPLSPDVPWEKKRIEIHLAEQMLLAFENERIVLQTRISSGIGGLSSGTDSIPTATPRGRFNIESKMPSKHMGIDVLTADAEAYNLPGVPWTCFFKTPPGYALHGAYWHNNYGVQMSHGCVNMRPEEAKWLFRWCEPKFEVPLQDRRAWEKRGYGTPVHII